MHRQRRIDQFKLAAQRLAPTRPRADPTRLQPVRAQLARRRLQSGPYRRMRTGMNGVDETFGYHADGVGPNTVVVPGDRMQEATRHHIGDVTAVCPKMHPPAVPKAVAGRAEDADHARMLLKENMIDTDTPCQRLVALVASRQPVPGSLAWACRRATEATA